MDLATIGTALASSLAGSIAATYWLMQEVIRNRLQRDLEARKAEFSQQLETHKLTLNQELERTKGDLQRDLARDKALVEGSIRKEIETQLGDSAAQRQYEFEARRRLYLAIGPLRFQLLLACRDLGGRIEAFAMREKYSMNIDGYYGRSTLYRMLRPLAICELIEEQVALADFSIDPGAIDCLRFRRTLTEIFSGDILPGDHPQIDWSQQSQHVYAGSLSICVRAMIDRTEGRRVLRFGEFGELLGKEGAAIVAPFDTLLAGLGVATKPILWLRLVAYANACNELVKRLGGPAFETRICPVEEMLRRGRDAHVLGNLPDYVERIRAVELVAL